MFSISLSDILKILDQSAIWKALVHLPRRVSELEARVAALEEQIGKRPPKSQDLCGLCGSPMQTISIKPDPTFGAFGSKEHTLKCTGCGDIQTKQVDRTMS